ncbi:MAG: SDR family oxidoreductase, partial [Bacteroidales bacterium]|nr:SDR family oxidoreductase [Bacteroidales bacterium]
MNYALITGVSSGIGYELALLFAKNGHNLILVSRQGNKLIQLADDLKKNYLIKILIISLDLSRTDAAEEIFGQVQEKSIHVNYLVNNAGFYVKGAFYETSWEIEQSLIQLQCLNHTQLTKLFLPAMIKQGKGGILNICSTGSFVPGPYNAVYCAAKSFVLSFSEAIAAEVSGTGVKVTALCPGGTNTNF